MTVSELIQKLAKLSPDAVVVFPVEEWVGLMDIEVGTVCSGVYNGDQFFEEGLSIPDICYPTLGLHEPIPAVQIS